MNAVLQPPPAAADGVAHEATAARHQPAGTAHLPFIHRARAVAIVFIVAMHCVDDFDWSNSHRLYRFLVELFQGSTVVFFMISGYLFQHLSERFRYAGYLEKKFKHVIVPYLVVSTPGIVLLLTKPEFGLENPELAGASWWLQTLFLYFYGGAQLNHVLWFVAVMSLYYLAAPLFAYCLRHPMWFLALALLIPISLLSHRPTTQKYHHLQLALYFLSAYLAGMAAGRYSERVLLWVDRHMALLVSAFVAAFVGHYWLTDEVGTYVDEAFSPKAGLIDWIFVQKFIFFFVLIGALKKLDAQRMKLVDHLATVSFAIYFLHVYVLYVYSHIVHWHQFPGSVTHVTLLLLATLVFTVAIAFVSRKLFGRRSRMLIGA